MAAVACHERDLAEVTRVLPIGVISATVDGIGCLVVPDPGGPGRHAEMNRALAGKSCAIGSSGPPQRLNESWRLARSALEAATAGALPGSGLLRSEDHLVELALFRSRDLIGRLREQTMAPIEGLTPKAHARMAETALAYVEYSGNAAEMARALSIHPQTARYRIARLRELFGDDLDRPDKRLALELSLRSA
jgi:sugar diacid utilization regulator